MSISYSERAVFTADEKQLLYQAERCVARIPSTLADSRCHEVARAVGHHLGLAHQDGFYGFVDHTWLWTAPFADPCYEPSRNKTRIGFPHVLDVYCVGSLPMVRLVDARHTSLPHIGWAYRPGRTRDDIDEARLWALIEVTREPIGSQPEWPVSS
jgi:hypothetical protein